MVTEDGFVVCCEQRDKCLSKRYDRAAPTYMSSTTKTSKSQIWHTTSSRATTKSFEGCALRQIEQRLQKVREFNKEKQERAEKNQKRKQKEFRLEQEKRKRILSKLKRDRENIRAKMEREEKMRWKHRLINHDEEERKKIKLLAHLKSVEDERRQRYEIRKQNAREEKPQKLSN
ncbi:capping protein inhibiting regulator of actin dynamics-like [Corticium candelabrum]|uniref:capping protein inhibiting regulator of actin dynamics-like n=1 Tax=Corticium candelabrum TaxID=121492 RepID=UPI002E26E97E|nr:capping protein inhibiting regulator of actin dynamics-like [Corticium candelabrum]